MPSAAGPGAEGTVTEADSADAGNVIAAESAHLARSREFLRLMRENVLTLAQNPMAGDRVSLESRKVDR